MQFYLGIKRKSYLHMCIRDYEYERIVKALDLSLNEWNKPLELPDHFIFRITMELMVDPVVN